MIGDVVLGADHETLVSLCLDSATSLVLSLAAKRCLFWSMVGPPPAELSHEISYEILSCMQVYHLLGVVAICAVDCGAVHRS